MPEMEAILPSQNEISSTEKLLKMIRKDDAIANDFSGSSIASQPAKVKGSALPKIFSSKDSITVGVDISSVELRLIKITKSSSQKWQLLAFKCLPLPPNISKDSQQFASFLQSAMSDFCSHSKSINIWTIISSTNVEVRHLQIPKVEKKEIANAVYWTVKKDFSFDEKENLFDFDVQDEIVVKGISKIKVTAYIAPKHEVKKITTNFSKTRVALVGMTIAPFAIQNLFRTGWLPSIEQTAASLYIGYDRSHIDIFSNGNLVMTRSIKTGIDSILESIAEGLVDYKKKISTESDKDVETFKAESYDMELCQRLLFGLGTDTSSIAEKEIGIYLEEEEIVKMALPTINRLIRQIENTFAYYSSTIEGESIRNISISGGIPFYAPMIDYIGEQLGFKVNVIDALDSSKVPFLGAVTPPVSISKRSSLGVAVGLALSDNSYTPNLVFTQQDEEKVNSIARVNRSMFSIFLVIMAVCIGIFWWMEDSAGQKKAVIVQLKQQAEQYNPLVNQKLILQMADTAKNNQKDLKLSSKKLLPIVAVAEVSNLAPINIRLFSIIANFGSHVINSGKTDKKHLVINGIVSGDPMKREAFLVKYVKRLENLPIFSTPEIQKKKPELYSVEDDVLHFVLKLTLV